MTAEREVVMRPLDRPGDLGWVVMAHGELYDREYGWDTSFEALVARIVADYAQRTGPGPQMAWIAEVDGTRAGCVFCVPDDHDDHDVHDEHDVHDDHDEHDDERTAKLRLLLVDPAARGLGLGTGLVQECLDFARQAGYQAVTLWTNDVLDAARRIYQKQGFDLVAEEPHHSFGHDLVGQTWRRRL